MPSGGAQKFDKGASSGGHAGKHEKTKMIAGERKLTAGLLAKNVSFHPIVNDNVGVKEIEGLIQKLERDKEILADPNFKKDEAAKTAK
jgi:hypothetical protein